MTPENFCYWLQGLLELSPDTKALNPEQVQMIRQHLGYVFNIVRAGSSPLVPSQLGGGLSEFAKQMQGLQSPISVVC